MESLMRIYRRVVHFTLRCVVPLQRCSCPVLTKGRGHTSDCSQLWNTEKTWERRVFVIAVQLLLDWASPYLVSPCNPTSVFLSCFLITWLFMGKLKKNLLYSPNLDSSLVFLSTLSLLSVSFQQFRQVQVMPDVRVQMCRKLYRWKDDVEYSTYQQQTKRTLRVLTQLLPTRLWDPRCFLGIHYFSHLSVTRDSHRLPSCHDCSTCFHSARDRSLAQVC